MLDEHDQLAVIHGLREGSRDAWARLYDDYSVEIWRYVARLLGPDAAGVGDIVQETFLEAARSARHFDSTRGTLWNWLTGIAHHRVRAHWREANRQKRLQQMAASGELDIRHLFDGQRDAKAVLESSDAANFVRSVLAEISVDYASLLTAKYLDERSLMEMSVQFGDSVEAIKSKLARARQEFRTRFEFMTKADESPIIQTNAESRSAAEKPS